jgi:hypothetical protein
MRKIQRIVIKGKPMEEISEEDAKLLAVLVDTDGSITTGLSEDKRYATTMISIDMHSLMPIIYAKTWGGAVHKGVEHKNGALHYGWTIQKRELTRVVLEKIKPFLVLKKEQAELALEMLDLLDRKPQNWQNRTLKLRDSISEHNHAPAPDVDLVD